MHSLSILLLINLSFGKIFFFSKKQEIDLEEKNDENFENLICKFVNDGTGRRIGESVSIDKDIIIIKSKKGFLGIPLKPVEDDGKILLVKGLVDLDKAYEMGGKWLESSADVLNEKNKNSGEKNGF